MKLIDPTSVERHTLQKGAQASSTGPILDALPEVRKPILAENSQTGVSTKNALPETTAATSEQDIAHWHVLRATYGRAKKAYDYLTEKGVPAFCPTRSVVKEVKGKKITVKEPYIPNILFVFGTEKEIQSHVYDNIHLPYLRFCYVYLHKEYRTVKVPLTIPTEQMESFKIICESGEDVLVLSSGFEKFKTGRLVRVTQGKFKGVKGVVARFQGQKRVGIIIEGMLAAVTAYVPGAFLEVIEEGTASINDKRQ